MLTLERIKNYAKTDRIALINREEQLTYRELDARSDAFAAWLLRRFGDDRTPVVLYGEKELDFLCCLFGALKSGRAYVPIDRSVLPERAAAIVADVEPKVIVDFGGFAPETVAVILDAAALAEILRSPPETEPQRAHWVSGEDAAYILFTSGSTGKPKGVPIMAANLESFRKGLLPYYPAGEGGVLLQGTKLWLVDGYGREITGDETPGKLQILGASVGPGYWRRPDLTERSFFIDAATGLRGYRTGDLCYRASGLCYYSGRTDNQLKLSGFRVELEDIEQNLAALPDIVRAAVVPVWKDEKVQYLAAFLLLRGPDGLSNLKRTIRLKRQLAERLPAYMIPRKLFVVEAFPLNVNGKIDKKALAKRLEDTP